MKDDPTRDQVVAQAKAWLPTPSERRWEQIGWAPDLRTARALAQKNQRLLFVFTLDGRMQVGRC